MDLPSLATGLSQSKLATDVSYAVAKKTLNSAKQQGEALVALIDDAGKVGASSPGKGGKVDTYA